MRHDLNAITDLPHAISRLRQSAVLLRRVANAVVLQRARRSVWQCQFPQGVR